VTSRGQSTALVTSSRFPSTGSRPLLLTERGLGVIAAATLIGEIAGADRFTSDSYLGRLAVRPDPSVPRDV